MSQNDGPETDLIEWIVPGCLVVLFLMLVAMVAHFYFGDGFVKILNFLSSTLLTIGLLALYKYMKDEQAAQTEIQQRQQKIMEADYIPKINTEVVKVQGQSATISCRNKGTGLAEIHSFNADFFVTNRVPVDPITGSYTYNKPTSVTATPIESIENKHLPLPFIRQKDNTDVIKSGDQEEISIEIHIPNLDTYDIWTSVLEDHGYKTVGCRIKLEYSGLLDDDRDEHVVVSTWTTLESGNTLEDLLMSEEDVFVEPKRLPVTGPEDTHLVIEKNAFET